MKPFSFLTSSRVHAVRITLAGLLGGFALAGEPLLAAERARDTGGSRALKSLDYSGDQQALVALDAEIAAAGTDAARLQAIARRLVPLLRQNDTTFAARQAICQRLALVLPGADPDTALLAQVGALLRSERDFELGRLALELVPGAAVDALFLKALDQAGGPVRIGLLQSIGARRIAAAIPKLQALLVDGDPLTIAAAARALGAIGTSESIAALRTAPSDRSEAVLQAQLSAASRLPMPEATKILRAIELDSTLPETVRAAAFRGLLTADSAAAPNRIVAALGGAEWQRKEVALEAVIALPAPSIVPALAGGLRNWDPPTQIAALTALGRIGHSGAEEAALAAATHADREVRRAALSALGRLPGTPAIARALAETATGGDPDDAKLARQSLARLNGPAIAGLVRAGAERGAPATRAMFLEQLALRNMPEALPLLLACRSESDVQVRTAALAALGDLAAPDLLSQVLDWTVTAADIDERARGLRSVVSIALRNPDAAQRGRLIYETVEAGPAETSERVLPALARLGGAASAESAGRAALRPEPAVANAATALLGRWTDRTALLPLAHVAENAAHPPARRAARDAALKYLERNREQWSADLAGVLARLMKTAPDPGERRRVIVLAARGNDDAAEAIVAPWQSDPEIGATAALAAESIRANRAGPPKIRASGGQELIKNLTDGKTDTRWTVPAKGEEWLEIDFHVSRPLKQLTLDQTGRTNEYPERYEVYVADDLAQLGSARTSGTGQRNRTVISMPPNTRGRYVVIKNVAEREDTPWAVCELFVD